MWKEEIIAFVNGKTIQRNVMGRWEDDESPEFRLRESYRIKPEPRERWLNVYKDIPVTEYAYPTKEQAHAKALQTGLPLVECVHYREVID